MVFVNEQDKYRTIDYDRNAILISTGGLGRGDAKNFELEWNNNKVTFTAQEDRKPDPDKDGQFLISWFVIYLNIPESLRSKREEVIELIRDALWHHANLSLKQKDLCSRLRHFHQVMECPRRLN